MELCEEYIEATQKYLEKIKDFPPCADVSNLKEFKDWQALHLKIHYSSHYCDKCKYISQFT